MAEFSGKVVLVTGAGRGSGREISLAFARAGAVTAINDLTPVNLDETLSQLRSLGAQTREYLFDVAKRMAVQAMIDQVVDDWGRLDILVNHAQVKPQAALLSMDEWDWHRTLDVNLSGAFFATQVAGKVMREQGGGSIVNVIAASEREDPPDRLAAYRAGKYGLLALTRSAAYELAPFGIRVNAVCSAAFDPWIAYGSPGVVASPEPEASQSALSAAVLWLCNEANQQVNGKLALVAAAGQAG